jgi:transcription antitermination factor NusG
VGSLSPDNFSERTVDLLLHLSVSQGKFPWYGIRTRSNGERMAAKVLSRKGYEEYLPVYLVRRRWSDRIISAEVPLFAGYIFCRFDANQPLPIVTTPSVVSIVRYGSRPAPISDDEIEAIKSILKSGIGAEPCPFLQEGERVRVTHGPLKNLEGILVKKKSDCRLVVSISMLQRSVSVEIDRDGISVI